jgi:hypothetical protein
MAQATKEDVPATVKYTLELSRAEVLTLGVILDNIGGNPNHSCRKHASDIAKALYQVGVYTCNTSLSNLASGSVIFDTDSEESLQKYLDGSNS